MPEVAVVIPAFNPGSYLLESIESVLAQTVHDLEIVIVDDGSRPDAIPETPNDQRIKVIHQANEGVSAARNRGVAETTASLVAFLDADDRWLPHKLERQLNAFEEHPEAVVCYTDFVHIAPDGRPLGPGWWAGPAAGYEDVLRANTVPLSSSMVRREAFDAAGRFDPFYLPVADWDLWLRMIRVGPFAFVDEPLMEYRLAHHNIGQMSGDPVRIYAETLSVLARHELLALRSGDKRALELISAGRRSARRIRAQQAAARFVDSIGANTEWPMLRAALSIHVPSALAMIGTRSARRTRHALGRTRSTVAARA